MSDEGAPLSSEDVLLQLVQAMERRNDLLEQKLDDVLARQQTGEASDSTPPAPAPAPGKSVV